MFAGAGKPSIIFTHHAIGIVISRMGQGVDLKCRKCGHEFFGHVGGGMLTYVQYCDRCGKSKDLPHAESFEQRGMTPREIKPEDLICSCGGLFEKSKPICPSCQSDDIQQGRASYLYD